MVNKILLIFLIIFLFVGCCKVEDEVNYPYKIVQTIYSKDQKTSVVIIQTGINSGATVGYEYQFFIVKKNNKLKIKNRFLWLNGLKKYIIKWTSFNTLTIKVKASSIRVFKGKIISKPVNYYITKFYYEYE